MGSEEFLSSMSGRRPGDSTSARRRDKQPQLPPAPFIWGFVALVAVVGWINYGPKVRNAVEELNSVQVVNDVKPPPEPIPQSIVSVPVMPPQPMPIAPVRPQPVVAAELPVQIREVRPTTRIDYPFPPQTQTAAEQENSLEMSLVYLPGGQFRMGAHRRDRLAKSDELPEHLVIISKPFYIGKFEVTRSQFKSVMNWAPPQVLRPGQPGDSSRLPIHSIGWFDAIEFCNRLSKSEGRTPWYGLEDVERNEENRIVHARIAYAAGNGYRLPTEAEWEYACRFPYTHNLGLWSFADNASVAPNFAWFDGNSKGGPHPVGEKRPNPIGLYDMHGNVAEFCNDVGYGSGHAYQASPQTDPLNKGPGDKRIRRGGSFLSDVRDLRTSARGESENQDAVGFRCVSDIYPPASVPEALPQSLPQRPTPVQIQAPRRGPGF